MVNLAADLLRGEVVAQGVAAWRADDVLVEDVRGARVGVWENYSILSGDCVAGGGGLACGLAIRRLGRLRGRADRSGRLVRVVAGSTRRRGAV